MHCPGRAVYHDTHGIDSRNYSGPWSQEIKLRQIADWISAPARHRCPRWNSNQVHVLFAPRNDIPDDNPLRLIKVADD